MKKKLLLLTLVLLSFRTGYAQEESSEDAAEMSAEAQDAPASEERAYKTQTVNSLILSSIQWNDTLKLQQGVTLGKAPVNYNGLIIGVQRDILYRHWGWSIGAFVGSGRANSGEDPQTIEYQEDKVPFTVYGLSPRVFYRHSGRISLGVTGMGFMKNVSWPNEDSTLSIDDGRKLNMTALFDINLRLFPRWDFYSGIGPLAEGATLWKIGLNFRF
ncbi:hypothetical protein [Bdellovibrio reynosensis]|uniref:Outer membrane protein beta-barrel domain-containing protein n=1 Tax=Bdellovibrio reynosensis TaxID=2835041 RepID=A0ABY4C9E5_9BACT|nr:hypothetical protein [Bdellovibrio reynosensis]UOF01611.1 hypothetical protein MNR06_01420 [Bdellovibrio reynosensis]